MRIRKCDRCGVAYENYMDEHNTLGITTFNLEGKAVRTGMWFDLCPDCMSELKNWIYTKPKESEEE